MEQVLRFLRDWFAELVRVHEPEPVVVDPNSITLGEYREWRRNAPIGTRF